MAREPARSFEDLIVWQKAHAFVLNTYRSTAQFPRHELYGLTSQFRRAAVSIAANIAEGFKKRGPNDKLRLMNVSQGSLEECRYYIILSRDLLYSIDHMAMRPDIEEVSRLLEAYMNAIRRPG